MASPVVVVVLPVTEVTSRDVEVVRLLAFVLMRASELFCWTNLALTFMWVCSALQLKSSMRL